MIRLASLAPLALAACAPAPPPKAPPPPPPEAPPPPTAEAGAQCDATVVQSLVGQPADATTVERARTGSGARTVRSFGPGDAVTMDFRPDRLNVERGADGRIVRLTCG